MSHSNFYTIKSNIELIFNNPHNRDISYNSFLPELNKVKSKRSKVKIEKSNNSILFHIESADITAFRASINDIISFGKIIENTLKLCQ
jgi:tRNA threonylcarbamoyladenosine modification (KEOPS) complex  Pcc1 subunit